MIRRRQIIWSDSVSFSRSMAISNAWSWSKSISIHITWAFSGSWAESRSRAWMYKFSSAFSRRWW